MPERPEECFAQKASDPFFCLDRDVAECNDIRPFHFGVADLEILGKAGGGLSDHDQFLQYRASQEVVADEVILLDIGKEVRDGVCGLDNVAQV